MDIAKIQALLQDFHLDGWLFSDFQGHDFISLDFLPLSGRKCTRRLFYYIPAQGEPVKVLSSIEPLLLDHLPGRKVLYQGLMGQTEALAAFLRPGHSVACQYSPRGNVPQVSSMDAGLIEYLSSFQVNLVSSADLMQHFGAVLTDEQVESHRQAGIIIHRILAQSARWIRSCLNKGQAIDEWLLLQKLKELSAQSSLHMDFPPFLRVDEHACDPGYEPQISPPNNHFLKPIKEGSRLIIDIAGRLFGEASVYYDVTWCMNVGPDIDPEYQRLFYVVKEARAKALSYIRQCLITSQPLRGCDVDALLREFFAKKHLEPFIMHRTGHNIGHNCHGIGANLDDYETHDDRCLLPGTIFSVEPGIYTERCGVRLEYDVHITLDKKAQIYGPVQEEILII